jgi:hypothetical protein
VPDYSLVLLVRAWQEPWHVYKRNNGDVERVTEADKPAQQQQQTCQNQARAQGNNWKRGWRDGAVYGCVLLVRSWQEAWHVYECDDQNVERVAEADEPAQQQEGQQQQQQAMSKAGVGHNETTGSGVCAVVQWMVVCSWCVPGSKSHSLHNKGQQQSQLFTLTISWLRLCPALQPAQRVGAHSLPSQPARAVLGMQPTKATVQSLKANIT